MNTTLISRLASFGIAFTMTFVMLASVNSLATSEPSPAVAAHVMASNHA